MATLSRVNAALSLSAVLMFLHCGVGSHCFVEGESVLVADHLNLIGIKNFTGEPTEIVALCVQTSSLFGEPYQIYFKLKNLSSEPEVEEGKCSCVAGLSERYKHLCAALLHCYSVRTDFICRRLCFCVLMCTPYKEKTAWRIVASRHRGVVYLHVHPTKKEVHQYLKERDHCSWDRITYWGVKFHRVMSTSEPGVPPKEDELVRERDSYNTVLRGHIGSHTCVISGEVKAVDSSVQCELGSTGSYVEFKTNCLISTEEQRSTFAKKKLLVWWAQSHLLGVPKGLCGFRHDNGIVMRVQEFDVKTMPDKAKGLWSEDVCMRFLNDTLNFIKEHVEGDDGRTVFLLKYEPSSCQITCKRLVDPGKLYSLPDWFLKGIEGC
uniref:Decapping nuclease n=1 Tax=Rhipicephalus zambeziensis TaxID=60191 RepID=A0A224YZM6_9ACAR